MEKLVGTDLRKHRNAWRRNWNLYPLSIPRELDTPKEEYDAPFKASGMKFVDTLKRQESTMGTKITTIEYIGPGRLTITAEAIGQARMKMLTMAGGIKIIPEDSFLNTHVHLTSDGHGQYKICDVGWTGQNADWLEHLATALSFTRGSADLLLVWDGAKSMEPFVGLRVEDGVVTKREVVMSLGQEVD